MLRRWAESSFGNRRLKLLQPDAAIGLDRDYRYAKSSNGSKIIRHKLPSLIKHLLMLITNALNVW